ncbi:MAG: hypothetical protein MUF73_11475 [Rhodobacteraceae bacterium]|jgi:hypothetical protein|nr:hypothetical protein [Paracoccaceae bacterium]
MATITTNAGARAAAHVKQGNNRPSLFARMLDFFAEVGDLRARTDQVQALMALSDERLAAKGLTRDTIVSHVFRDKMYL